jgi:hypothetical protein
MGFNESRFSIMAQYRSQSPYQIGSEPPQSVWTIVRGDTASFKMYVQDDSGNPLVIGDWSIEMDFYREGATSNPILTVTPSADLDDGPGEFTVFLESDETENLQTDDEFDIQMSLPANEIVWTVLQGTIKMIEDITD